jgi:hypothetical protein
VAHHAGARHVGQHHDDDHGRGEEIDMQRRQGVAQRQPAGIGAEGLGDHGEGDQQADQEQDREPARQHAPRKGSVEILHDAARPREAAGEASVGIARQQGDGAADGEREVDVAAGHQRRLAQQREDAGAHHRANAERRHAPHRHR